MTQVFKFPAKRAEPTPLERVLAQISLNPDLARVTIKRKDAQAICDGLVSADAARERQRAEVEELRASSAQVRRLLGASREEEVARAAGRLTGELQQVKRRYYDQASTHEAGMAELRRIHGEKLASLDEEHADDRTALRRWRKWSFVVVAAVAAVCFAVGFWLGHH